MTARFMFTLMWVFAVLMLLLSVLACPAFADSGDNAYLSALHARGFVDKSGGDAEMVSIGYKICAVRQQGVSEEQIVAALAAHTASGVTAEDVLFIVRAAETYLCPQVMGLVV